MASALTPADATTRCYTVGQLAKLAHVTVRTLHHYDAIGLLRPSRRTASGYRLYGPDDLERLQQVLLYRELDFPLDAIARLVLDPDFDRREALTVQRDELERRARRLTALTTAIDAAIEALEGGTTMDDESMFEVLGDFDPAAHEIEVRERWGETDAYAESARRTARYTKEDWSAIKAQADDIVAGLADAFDAGSDPASAAFQS